MTVEAPSSGAVVTLRDWRERRMRRPPTRDEVEAVLTQVAFREELFFDGLCDLHQSGQAARLRLQRTTNALMSLIEGSELSSHAEVLR